MQTQRELIRLQANEFFRVLRWSRSVAAVEVVLGRGRAVPVAGQGEHWHYHPALELTLILKGSGTRLIADDINRFSDGDLVLIGSNVPHYWHMHGSSTGLAVQWDFPLEPGIWSDFESAQLRALTDTARRGMHITGITRVHLRSEMEKLVHATGLSRLGLFLNILGILADAPKRDVTLLSSQPFSLESTAETQEIIRRAVSYLLVHYRDKIHLSELLRLTGMSRATFARQFVLHVGKSFSTFRNQVRLQAVCQALHRSREPVGSIAFNHGFNQLAFFNRLFHREFGMSPSQYRRTARSDAAPP